MPGKVDNKKYKNLKVELKNFSKDLQIMESTSHIWVDSHKLVQHLKLTIISQQPEHQQWLTIKESNLII